MSERSWKIIQTAGIVAFVAAAILLGGAARSHAESNLITCDGREVICDPVPGVTTDGEVFNGATIVQLQGSIANIGGEAALYGNVIYDIPDMPSGGLSFQCKGFCEHCYFARLVDDLNESSPQHSDLGAMWQRGGLRVELAKTGCCESDPLYGSGKINTDANGFQTMWIEWTPSVINFYQGPEGAKQLLFAKPNAVGIYHPPNWKGNSCKGKRKAGGPIIVSRIQLPAMWRNKTCNPRYYVRNVRLVRQ